jgi:hypothetical protein
VNTASPLQPEVAGSIPARSIINSRKRRSCVFWLGGSRRRHTRFRTRFEATRQRRNF